MPFLPITLKEMLKIIKGPDFPTGGIILGNSGIKKAYMIHTLTDETYSLVCNNDAVKDVNNKHFYYFMISP